MGVMSVTIKPLYSLTDDSNFYFGLILAISSSLFIGSSFIIKKKALIKLNRKGCLRAGSGGFGYLKEWIWWIGLICMGVGEISNFAAYTFAPASLVTALGALSVLVSAILSSIILKEHLNVFGKLGCVLCVLGSTILIIHSAANEETEERSSILEKLQQSTFILYVALVILSALLIVFHFGPRYGSENVIWYIILCASVGSLTVMSCKCLGILLRGYFTNDTENLNHWLTYSLCLSIITCIVLQMVYLNRSLDLFNTSIVTPLYYVFFTIFVIIASSILFREYQKLNYIDLVGNICGFLIIVIAVVLLNAFKSFDINLYDMRNILKPKRELVTELNNCLISGMSFTRNI